MALYNDKRMQIYSFSVIYRNFKILPNLGEAVDQVLLTWIHVEGVVRAAIAGDAVDKVLLTWLHELLVRSPGLLLGNHWAALGQYWGTTEQH